LCNPDGSGCGLIALQSLFDPAVSTDGPVAQGFEFNHTDGFDMSSVSVLLNAEEDGCIASSNKEFCTSCKVLTDCGPEDGTGRRFAIDCVNVLPDILMQDRDACSAGYFVDTPFEFLITVAGIQAAPPMAAPVAVPPMDTPTDASMDAPMDVNVATPIVDTNDMDGMEPVSSPVDVPPTSGVDHLAGFSTSIASMLVVSILPMLVL